MELTKEQINMFCSYISISDIHDYIKNHRKEYEDFLKNNKEKSNK